MQSPASGTEAVPQESSTGKKYQCDACSAVIFVEFEPVRRRSDALIHNHYANEHPEIERGGGLRGATYVGWGSPDWGTEEP